MSVWPMSAPRSNLKSHLKFRHSDVFDKIAKGIVSLPKAMSVSTKDSSKVNQ